MAVSISSAALASLQAVLLAEGCALPLLCCLTLCCLFSLLCCSSLNFQHVANIDRKIHHETQLNGVHCGLCSPSPGTDCVELLVFQKTSVRPARFDAPRLGVHLVPIQLRCDPCVRSHICAPACTGLHFDA